MSGMWHETLLKKQAWGSFLGLRELQGFSPSIGECEILSTTRIQFNCVCRLIVFKFRHCPAMKNVATLAQSGGQRMWWIFGRGQI